MSIEHQLMRQGVAGGALVRWEPMRLEYLGNVGAVVQGGGGKLSGTGGDPGEIRKPKGCEPIDNCPVDGDGPGTFTPGFGHGPH